MRFLVTDDFCSLASEVLDQAVETSTWDDAVPMTITVIVKG
jgi:hypothetical protein